MVRRKMNEMHKPTCDKYHQQGKTKRRAEMFLASTVKPLKWNATWFMKQPCSLRQTEFWQMLTFTTHHRKAVANMTAISTSTISFKHITHPARTASHSKCSRSLPHDSLVNR